jgi:hypothetical protein
MIFSFVISQSFLNQRDIEKLMEEVMENNRKHRLCKIMRKAMLLPVFTFLFITFFLPLSSISQISFERTYGGPGEDQGISVQQTSDGGYIMVGHKGLSAGGMYMVKTDSLGDTVWTRTSGNINDALKSVRQTSDGGYITVGGTNANVLILKTDSLGNTLWTREYGGPTFDGGICIQMTSDGGYIIVGGTSSSGGDVYLLKTDSLGDTLWTRTYGGADNEGGVSVQQTSDSGYIIAGTRSIGPGMADIYVIKTDSLGDTLWTKIFGGIWQEEGRSVQKTADGGYIIAGTTRSFGASNGDVYVVKTDSLGDTLWTKMYGGLGVDNGRSIQQTSDGGYIITGSTEFWGAIDLYLVKTNSFGDTLWTKTFGDTAREVGRSVQQTSDGGYIIVGSTESFGAGGEDVYLIKAAGDGTVGIDEEFTKSKVNYSKITLLQNLPNPFQRWTVIGYSLPETRTVTLKIYDINGRLVETLVNDQKEPGFYEVQWDGKNQANGIYFYRLSNNKFSATKKMILLK